MERTKIAIADDEIRVFLEALRSVIDEEDDMRELLETADNGADTMKMIHESQPDVVLLDLIMPDRWNYCYGKVRADKNVRFKARLYCNKRYRQRQCN